MYCVAKVARQIVDYFTLALNTLEQGGGEDGTISDTVGTKFYKVMNFNIIFFHLYPFILFLFPFILHPFVPKKLFLMYGNFSQ